MRNTFIQHHHPLQEAPPCVKKDSARLFCRSEAARERLPRFEEAWKPEKSICGSFESTRKFKFDAADVNLGRTIGRGSFSSVYMMFLNPEGIEQQHDSNHCSSRQCFALKRLTKGKSTMDGDEDYEEALQHASADLLLEAAILVNLQHENIIQFHGVSKGDVFESIDRGEFFIVLDLLHDTLDARLTEWMHQRSVLDFFKQNTASTAAVVLKLKNEAMGIAKGMEYLHSKKIIFRDLKPSNIGFDEFDRVKIFDFGLARDCCTSDCDEIPFRYQKKSGRLMTAATGTPRYMAPEVFMTAQSTVSSTATPEHPDDGKDYAFYGLPADVYSFAILLWQIATNKVPFCHLSTRASIADKVTKGNERPNLKGIESVSLKSLLEQAWSPDPDKRPSFTQICQSLDNIILKHEDSVEIKMESPKVKRGSHMRAKELECRQSISPPPVRINASIRPPSAIAT